MNFKLSSPSEMIKAAGLVFGDIGTSPIYTLVIVFTFLEPTLENILGILSLIFWTLIILVTMGYWWLAMSLSSKGEGGMIVLKEILSGYITKGRPYTMIAFFGYIGMSLLMGDGVLTPAITLLSGVEGLTLIPGLEDLPTYIIIGITLLIATILFSVQYTGTDKVTSISGIVMVLWFLALFGSGIYYISSYPQILLAVSPYYAIEFMTTHGFIGVIVLSEVILCATGAEALYADMGHLGANPIRSAWIFVFIALVINYFGQGVFVSQNPNSKLYLFAMVNHISGYLYVPFLILTLMAAVIASQAMISAVFSLVYQGITTRIFPLMKIKYTSLHLKSQIYIGAVNWSLFIAVIIIILVFKESKNLGAAYGIAVVATMTISCTFMILIFFFRKNYLKFAFSVFLLIVELIFLGTLFTKIPHGGYWSFIIASVPFFTTLLWLKGQTRVRKAFRALSLETFKISYEQLYSVMNKIEGTALFFTRSIDEIPPYMAHCIISSNIIYERSVLVSIARTDVPFGIESEVIENLGTGLSGLVIKAGYQEILDLAQILKKHQLKEKVIFYGMEDIQTSNPLLKIYAALKKLSPNFVQFYKLPYSKIHGVVSRIQI